ncbi:MAG: chromosome segregation protein SMC [Chloroflexota bacterium]
MPLRLKSLELHGYKTFASRLDFQFGEGITAIVGPNGSGKSNIADSLRWVLGEQSYGLLRGKKTEDMIFAGSEHRPKAGMASATIVFDNTNGWLPVDFSEVALTRRAYRDGHNEYLLNGQHVRLRDIHELLAQSGLGERTYTILGQGLVDASLALKADERRRLFEEAAGIGLYRSRREEALKRLETTRRNLERVLDIMAELGPRLKSLERQARRAQEYQRAQADLRVLLLDWYGYHWHRAQDELARAREVVHQQEAKAREAREAHAKIQTEFGAFRERLSGLRAQLNAWHRQSAELHNRRESLSRELAVLDERRRALIESQQTLLADRERLAGEETLARERLADIEQEFARLQTESDDAKSQSASAQAALTDRQGEREAAEARLTQARNQVNELSAKRAETQARLDELASRLQSQQGKLETARRAIQTAEAQYKTAEAQSGESRAQREQAEAVLRNAEQEEAAEKSNVEKLEDALRSRTRERDARAAEGSRLQAQLQVIEEAEASLAGYAEGARFLLDAARQSRLAARGALSAALDVPAELETAFTAALGDSLDAILLTNDSLEDALRLLESDEAGRAAILPLNGAHRLSLLKSPSDPDCLGAAASLLSVSDELKPAVEALLGNTLIVKNRSAARRLLNGLPPHARIVTLAGEVFRADGLILAGKAPRSGTLGRPRQKRETQASLDDLTTKLSALEADVTRLASDLETARRDQAAREADVRSARGQVEQARGVEQKSAIEAESARQHFEFAKSQLETLTGEIAAAESDRARLTGSQSEIEASAAAAHETIRVLSGELAGLTLDELQEQVSYWGTRVAVAERALSDSASQRSERLSSVGRLESQIHEFEQRLKEVERSVIELDADKVGLRRQESELGGQIEEFRLKIEPAEKDLETAEQQETQLQAREAEAQRAMTNAERMLGQVQLEQTRKQEALVTLRQRVEDDFGLVQFDYSEDVSGPVPLPLDGMVEQLPVVLTLPLELEEQMTRARQQLRRMGAVNPEAQQEYVAESERYGFMSSQVEDLRKAEADLRQVIAELDDLTQREFHKTFEHVASEFRNIFVRLFGGGSARLTLTDPDNLVETGIEIEARLPGRREQGLALLSGGERSLTAIALVFALLKVSPTPVCVMDEVDAMLDEANVGRFRDLLHELSRDTQFVVITHNRSTVQAADVIYGVTMGRDSSSQVISLKLDEISEEMLGGSRK